MPETSEPLSFAQRRLWFLDQLTDDHTAYLARRTWRLAGPVDPDRLERALRWVAGRHDVLRCRIVVRDGEPAAVYDPADSVRLDRIDLRATADPEDAAWRRIAELTARPCDLAAGPLLHAALLRVSDNLALFHYTVHHIAFDGVSRLVFEDELGAGYAAGRVPQAAPLPARYADHSRRQHALLAAGGAELTAQQDYWRAELAGLPAALDLPADRPRPAAPTYRGARLSFEVLPEVTGELLALARQERASAFAVALAGYQYVLGRFADTDDPRVGIPVAGRSSPEWERVIGLFTNTVVVRAELAAASTFRELVRQQRDRLLDAMDHQDLPFERVVEIVAPERDASRNPVAQHWFSLLDGELAEAGLALPGVECQHMTTADTSCRFDTELELGLADGRLTGTLGYAVELFDESTMEELLGCYRHFLAAAVSRPDARLDRLPLLDADRRARLLRLAGDRPPAESTLPIDVWFDRQAARTPAALAVADHMSELTYRELAGRAGRLAVRLRAAGIGVGAVVGVFLPRGVAWVVALLGAVKAGAAYLPVDTDAPPARVRQLLTDAQADLVLTDSSGRDRLAGQPELPRLLVATDEPDSGADPVETSSGPLDAPVYLIYTSGSTGRPKGVSVSHRAFGNLVRWHLDRYPTGPADRIAQLASSSFDAAGWEVWPTLLSGAGLDICPDEIVRDPDALVAWLGERGCTQAFAPTPLAELLISQPLAERTKLTVLRTGGDVFRPSPKADPGVPVVNHYGPTENAVVATASGPLSAPWTDNSLGRPITGVRAYLLDQESRLVPRGAIGELCLSGASVADGYRGRPSHTADRFRPDPFSDRPGDRLYRTGDLARWRTDGTLQFLGRRDAQLKVRGYRIEPAEVEAALLADPAVAQAAVVAGRGRAGQPVLAGCVVPANGAVATEELRARLLRRLPAYLVPEAFVVLPELPLTASGKVDRNRLPVIELTGPDLVEPRSEVERVLCGLWAEVLGAGQIGVTEDFFALGGNSMTAAKLLTRIRAAFAIDFPLRGLFDHRTVARLGAAVEATIVAEIAAMSPEQITAELRRDR